MLRVKVVLYAAIGVTVALVFFPLWLAVPVAALLGGYGLGMAAFGASVTLDTGAGLLRMRLGPVFQRIRLTNVAAVLVDENKVTIKRASRWEVSLYAWGKGPLDRLLGGPSVAGDIGHAISAAVALAKSGPDPAASGTAPEVAPRQERPAGQGHRRPATGPGWPQRCSGRTACWRSAARSSSAFTGRTPR